MEKIVNDQKLSIIKCNIITFINKKLIMLSHFIIKRYQDILLNKISKHRELSNKDCAVIANVKRSCLT